MTRKLNVYEEPNGGGYHIAWFGIRDGKDYDDEQPIGTHRDEDDDDAAIAEAIAANVFPCDTRLSDGRMVWKRKKVVAKVLARAWKGVAFLRRQDGRPVNGESPSEAIPSRPN